MSSDAKWFLQLHGQIQGPFTTETLHNLTSALGEAELPQALVWKKGLVEWVPVTQWAQADQNYASPPPFENAISTTVDGDDLFDKTFQQSFTEGAFYRAQIDFVDQPLMSKDELMALIARQQDVSVVSIQDPVSKEWKEVYAFPDIVERLGLSRRKQARVPILAQFSGKTNKNNTVNYRVITISQGGMGFTENFDLKIGDEVEGQISSPHFFQSVHVKAEVIYAGQDGYIGLKFAQLTDEAKAAIIDYIKKFGKSSAYTP